jgi:undecaprenyl-diphosphatase
LAWLIVVATIPVGVCGLLLEHLFRTMLGRPVPAAAFLIANGAVLYVGKRLRRRANAIPEPVEVPGPAVDTDTAADERLSRLRSGAPR